MPARPREHAVLESNEPTSNEKLVTEVRHPSAPKSLKSQRVRRSKIATRAQHSRAAPVAQVYIAELG